MWAMAVSFNRDWIVFFRNHAYEGANHAFNNDISPRAATKSGRSCLESGRFLPEGETEMVACCVSNLNGPTPELAFFFIGHASFGQPKLPHEK